MKRYVPIKYILGMIAIFIIIPITMIILMLAVVGENDLTIAISIFFGFLVLAGPFVYIKNQENASIVIDNHTIINYMNDGTQNFGWSEDIKRIKKIDLVDCEKAKQYYKNCKSKKVLLIDFGSYNIKYISVSLFSDGQIKRILKDIKNN